MKRWMKCLIGAVVFAALMGGCASSAAVRQARQAHAEAGKATAETKAPYEYHAGKEYLRIAEYELGQSCFQSAREFAETSQEFSRRALEKSGGGAR